MRYLLIYLVLIIFCNIGFSLDSTSVVIENKKLIEEGNYASANEQLKNAVQELGFQPYLICLMVQNALENYISHNNFISFYLINSFPHSSKNQIDNKELKNVSYLRSPDQLLRKILNQYPDHAPAYKLMGDFYKLIYIHPLHATFEENNYDKLEEKIFFNYSKAVQLKYSDVEICGWVGDYYFKRNQTKLAKEFYLKNVEKNFNDTSTFFNLAKIYFQEKQFSKSYDFAMKALPGIPLFQISDKHEATKIAALSLLYFGEEERFLKYINKCIQLLPDEQSCYLSLLKYYDEKQNVDEMEKVIFQMLGHNPYDLEGFNYVENFIIKYNRFLLGEKLFENIILKYENIDQVMGNAYLFRGNLFFNQGMPEEAKKMWEISKNYFGKYLPENDPIFKGIGQISNKSSMK